MKTAAPGIDQVPGGLSSAGTSGGAIDPNPVAPADHPDSLVALALRCAPSTAALAERIAASREMSRSAGAWPDPMVSFSLNGERYPGKLLGEDPMVMGTVMLNQGIPFPGKSGLRRRVAEAETGVAQADWSSMRRTMASDIRSMYADLYAMDAMSAALRETQASLDLLVPAAATRYSAGLSMQADLLEAQLQQSRVREQSDDLAAEREVMAAKLNAMMGRAAGYPVRTGRLPVNSPPPDLAGSETAPGVMVRRQEVEVARWKAAVARREAWPNLSAGVEYGWRNGLPPMVTATLGLELPVWKSGKQDAEARAAGHELEMARQDLRMAEVEADGEEARLRAARDNATRQVELYRSEIVPRSELLLDSRRSGYVAGAGSGIRDVIAAYQMLLEARSALARREADLYKAGVALNALAGADPLVPGEGDAR